MHATRRKDHTTWRLHARLLIAFANAQTTDDAAQALISGARDTFRLSEAFFEYLRERFPRSLSIDPLRDEEKRFLELVANEQEHKKQIAHQIHNLSHYLDGYDPLEETLTLSQFPIYGTVAGTGDFCIDANPAEPFTLNLREFFQEFASEIRKELEPDFPSRLHELFQIGKSVAELKSTIDECRLERLHEIKRKNQSVSQLHSKIERIQDWLRRIFGSVVDGKAPDEIRELKKFLENYSDIFKSRDPIWSLRDRIGLDPYKIDIDNLATLIDFMIKIIMMSIIVLLIFPQYFSYIGKCHNCGSVFIAERINRKKFCNALCRSRWQRKQLEARGEKEDFNAFRKMKRDALDGKIR